MSSVHPFDRPLPERLFDPDAYKGSEKFAVQALKWDGSPSRPVYYDPANPGHLISAHPDTNLANPWAYDRRIEPISRANIMGPLGLRGRDVIVAMWTQAALEPLRRQYGNWRRSTDPSHWMVVVPLDDDDVALVYPAPADGRLFGRDCRPATSSTTSSTDELGLYVAGRQRSMPDAEIAVFRALHARDREPFTASSGAVKRKRLDVWQAQGGSLKVRDRENLPSGLGILQHAGCVTSGTTKRMIRIGRERGYLQGVYGDRGPNGEWDTLGQVVIRLAVPKTREGFDIMLRDLGIKLRAEVYGVILAWIYQRQLQAAA